MTSPDHPRRRNPWLWVPSLYFAQGLPYVVVMTVSVIMYKRLGISNTDIALYTSWLYLPWVVKPLWSPLVDLLRTKRLWIIVAQLVVGASLAMVALTIPLGSFFQYTLAMFWLLAFSSATHDIAADGFYMLGLEQHHQAAFVGVRSTFYRIAMIAGQGLLVVLAGEIETATGGNVAFAWSTTFGVLALLFAIFFVYHKVVLPFPEADGPPHQGQSGAVLGEFVRVFVLFFKKRGILLTLAFLLLYRFAEAQLVKLASPFMLDAAEKGGLGLTTSDVGFVYGTVGIIALTAGGLIGGYAVSRQGLKFWLPWMVLAINVPDAVYVYLAHALPSDLLIINGCVALEQLGYGFGFTAYLMYMIYTSRGEHATAHYAICTGIMALGMMLPGMMSGWMQEMMGYRDFFIWVCLATVPSFVVAFLIRVEPEFGKKQESSVQQ